MTDDQTVDRVRPKSSGHAVRTTRPRGPEIRSGECPSAHARPAVLRTRRLRPGSCDETTCRRQQHAVHAGRHQLRCFDRLECRRVVKRARVRRARGSGLERSSSITTGSRKRGPPWTTRCATASIPSGTSANESTRTLFSSASTAWSFRLVEPALTTRIAPTARFSRARSSRGSPADPLRARDRTRGLADAHPPSPGGDDRPYRPAVAGGRSRR